MGIRTFVQDYKKFFSATYTPKPSSTGETPSEMRDGKPYCMIVVCLSFSLSTLNISFYVWFCNFRLALLLKCSLELL